MGDMQIELVREVKNKFDSLVVMFRMLQPKKFPTQPFYEGEESVDGKPAEEERKKE